MTEESSLTSEIDHTILMHREIHFGGSFAVMLDYYAKRGKRAMFSLFEIIGKGDFFDEDIVINALKQIGDPAKKFLLTILKSTPITFDNERAAVALIAFKEDPEVSKTCLNMLLNPEMRQQSPLATYLTITCEGLLISKIAPLFSH